MDSVWANIGLILIFVLVGGAFSGAEIAIVSLRESQVRGMAERGRRGKRLAKLVAEPNRYLAAVQVGVTLAGFLSAAFGAAALSGPFSDWLVGLGMADGFADVLALVVVTIAISYVSLVLGELVPKRLALQRAEQVAELVAGPVDRVATIFRPLIWLLSRSTDIVVRIFGGDPKASGESISSEELRDLVAAHEALGSDERRLINDVFNAGERQISEVMVPRTEVEFLESTMTVSKAAKLVADTSRSRYPVIGRDTDDVLGFVHVRDLLRSSQKGGRATTVGDISRDVLHMPGSKKVLVALSEMRRNQQHLAIVADEYGGTDGIVTLEDLIEEVIGDIRDEYDEQPQGSRRTGSEVDVDGLLNLDDFAEETGVELPDGPYETVAGYVLSELGHLPDVGDQVRAGDHLLTVMAMDGRRVARLHVSVAPELAEESAQRSEGKPDSVAAQESVS
ncbi:MAG: HlyC/CorC family transporter [Geodermatophilaceae bacterium]|nr:HlyC/CorC family transporter [Geodermatophilaceae bacterium]